MQFYSFNTFLNILFPPECIGCHIRLTQGILCTLCYSSIKINDSLLCGSCRSRLPYGKKLCHRNFPFILGAAGEYADPVLQALIHGLKFSYIKQTATLLGDILVRFAALTSLPTKNTIVVPVPLGKERLRQRGFNQVELIARYCADAISLPIDINNLVRIRNTPPQSERKNLEERISNVTGCFSINNSAELRGKNILLIDDVVTSGSTLREAAQILKAGGARRVIALVAAKA